MTGATDASLTLNTEALAFNATGTSLVVSQFFRTITSPGSVGTEVRVSDLGFLSDPGNFLNLTNTHLAVRLRSNSTGTADVIFRNSNADTGAASTSFAVTGGTWYKESFTITNVDAAAGTVQLKVAFDQYNSTGSAVVTPNAFTYTQNTTLALLTGDNTVYGGFRVRNALRLFDTLDEFSQSAVPEPASVGLLALGGIGLLARRRRGA